MPRKKGEPKALPGESAVPGYEACVQKVEAKTPGWRIRTKKPPGRPDIYFKICYDPKNNYWRGDIHHKVKDQVFVGSRGGVHILVGKEKVYFR